MPSVGIIGLNGQEMARAFLRMYGGNDAYCYHITDKQPEQKLNIVVADEVTPIFDTVVTTLGSDDFLIVNADDKTILNALKKIPKKSKLITYGFNNRACITASSVTNDCVQVCIQRGFFGLDGQEREPQEFSASTKGEQSMSVLGAAAAWVVLNTK